MNGWALLLPLLCGPIVLSCGEPVAVRPQLLVFVDTNALIADQALREEQRAQTQSWSGGRAHLALDTLRVDLIATDGSIVDYLDVVAPAAEQWPLSFGVAAEDVEEGPLFARLRLFSGEYASRGQNAGAATLEPDAALTIDRVIALNFPETGVRKLGVFMDANCIGTHSRFLPELQTCTDGTGLVDARKAFEDLNDDWTQSRAGTWKGLRELPCTGEQPEGSVCVEGGFFYFGEPSLALSPIGEVTTSYPMRPVLLSPFWLDRDEFTVGRMLEVMASDSAPALNDEVDLGFFADCTWRGKDDPTKAALPLNCVTARDAEQLCRALGGTLPSEAQWEYTARGHAARFSYPWGDQPGDCCTARASRLEGSPLNVYGECPGYGPLPFEEADATECELHDVSIDGVRDMGGNLSEPTLDRWIGLDQDSKCWPKEGILKDPTCRTGDALAVLRGGEWAARKARTLSALRAQHYVGLSNVTQGFRCAYPVRP